MAAKKDWMSKLSKLDGAVNERLDPHEHVLRTHSPSLNFIYGNGWGLPLGHSAIFYGPPKSGKTIIGYDMIGTLHSEDPEAWAIRFDTEYRDHGQLTEKTAGLYGIDLSRYKAIETNHPAEIYDQADRAIRTMLQEGLPLKLMIIDSMSGVRGRRSIDSKKEGGASVMDQQIGDVAQTNKEGLKIILQLQRKYKFSLLMTAHVAIEMDQAEQKRGNKWKMGASVGVQHHAEYFAFVEPVIGKAGTTEFDGTEQGHRLVAEGLKDMIGWSESLGHKIRVTMKGSSMGRAGRHGQFTFDYDKGIINQAEECWHLGKARNVIYHPPSKSTGNPDNSVWAIRDYPQPGIKGAKNFIDWFKTDTKAQEHIINELKRQDREGLSIAADKQDEAQMMAEEGEAEQSEE